ncbi:cysteine-rich motor neuron 1 protein [Cephus cinctus]|uniref:Cysteine-rich motor neuron 1 protein n=1 Tax=Cephus cinctus TaxID=211228 RepID=A0AAJ7W3D6_CEPCN|nr:cysteine-rich motor neuron 1 protein [Cephus cinctus]XP_024943070.1 cysteine-rich motor neuron 1 protein [Cephus cinctus]
MRVPLVFLGGIVVLSVAVARALSCVCSPLECDLLTDEDCPGGLTWDPCKCCKVCARVEGEPCGGLFGFSGSCAVGLQCVIRNLLDHAREVDEGTCTKIPGRWRRHCPHGPKLSDPGCNLVDEGVTTGTGSAAGAGKCVCGPSVLWCPDEPQPYTYRTRHECKLNLAAKAAYDDLFNSPENSAVNGGYGTAVCPEDSVTSEDGGCKCVSPCPPYECGPGQRPVQVRAASPEIPGSCCPLYNCKPSESVSYVDVDEDHVNGTCRDSRGQPRASGERWKENSCTSCICEEGNPSCQTTMCKSCENVVPAAPGECCGHCPVPVLRGRCEPLRDCELHCDNGYVKDANSCPTCNCSNERTGPDSTSTQDKVCPNLSHCELDCELKHDEGGCPVCACRDSSADDIVPGNVDETGGKTVCPALNCDHCEYGYIVDENGCTLCECKVQPGCTPVKDCKKKCPFGYRTNKRGCQTCRCQATCVDHLNETRPEGSSWNPNSCTTCTCDTNGRLSCKETVCSVACSNPLPPEPGACCPVCPITVPDKNDGSHPTSRHWQAVLITISVVLAVLCIILIVHIVRHRFRGRLSPSEASYASYPPQYYKCVPAYDTPVHQGEKIVRL